MKRCQQNNQIYKHSAENCIPVHTGLCKGIHCKVRNFAKPAGSSQKTAFRKPPCPGTKIVSGTGMLFMHVFLTYSNVFLYKFLQNSLLKNKKRMETENRFFHDAALFSSYCIIFFQIPHFFQIFLSILPFFYRILQTCHLSFPYFPVNRYNECKR